ncbi:sel1 repeat family protein [Rheinheimera nanhaiensis]|uniref:Sel1 repeat family protein n=1 Tax=Rheinheimera nanhaiensis E407-8 TaxID=562729 RepID=I1DYY6_9GAMM|nr:sel1 repeat family protein [Rheinheimera nanhaiensis]GAB59264.1 hypothetical protein RNAN_2256 [Rheinheimera nanhaiensis E407-8]
MTRKIIAMAATVICVLGGFTASASSVAQDNPTVKEVKLRAEFYQNELDLLLDKARRGNFADFYQDVVKFAHYGEKYPQYLLGVMLLKGDGVQQDIGQGLVWIRLALEQKNTEWQKVYDSITAKLTKEQLDALEPMYETYKARFGVQAQKMSCNNEKMEASNIRIHQCRKTLVLKEFYSVYEYN